ncbi:MAG: hypothetical protein JWM80_5440 [Cyanobacteria bacterium RYN_339]|nr:hypothetical protein [Cyanobacteria bacterium RYN_339]
MKARVLATLSIVGTLLGGCSANPGLAPASMTLGVQSASYNLACGCSTDVPVSTGDVTGGGWVIASCGCGGSAQGNRKVTFGLVAHETPQGQSGNIEVNDHNDGLNYHGRVNHIARSGNTVTFSGDLVESNEAVGTFVAVVTDSGEPGKNDRFGFRTNSRVIVPVGTGLGGGNIQIHPTH